MSKRPLPRANVDKPDLASRGVDTAHGPVRAPAADPAIAGVAHEVRMLIAASTAIHRVANSRPARGSVAELAKRLCEAVLQESEALAEELSAQGASSTAHPRLVQLLVDGQALAEAAGALDSPFTGHARLMDHAVRLGPSYVSMLRSPRVN